jgi:hypothetical protein
MPPLLRYFIPTRNVELQIVCGNVALDEQGKNPKESGSQQRSHYSQIPRGELRHLFRTVGCRHEWWQ